ncbi:hypothetical protein ACF8OH_04590 [Delftia sp. WSY_9]|uniref:ATP-binding protein n=1 Tax=Delftia TaxID=80865 RepID=UPI001314B474|nr:ATP-binding protein [Delftia lacustris]
MVKIFHLVGAQGSGKSTHAQMLSKFFEAQGLRCAGVDDPDSEFVKDRDGAMKHWPEADVIFLEHLPGEQFKALPCDQVISLARGNDGEAIVRDALSSAQDRIRRATRDQLLAATVDPSLHLPDGELFVTARMRRPYSKAAEVVPLHVSRLPL